MSSTRNKRKRTETDSRSGGRPKSREQRDAGVGRKINEGSITAVATTNGNPENNNQVDSSTVATRQQQAIAQDASVKERDAAAGDGSVPMSSNNQSNIHSDRHKGSLSQNVASATKPLHSREISPDCDPSGDGPAHETNRSARLQGLIAHRSILRRRI